MPRYWPPTTKPDDGLPRELLDGTYGPPYVSRSETILLRAAQIPRHLRYRRHVSLFELSGRETAESAEFLQRSWKRVSFECIGVLNPRETLPSGQLEAFRRNRRVTICPRWPWGTVRIREETSLMCKEPCGRVVLYEDA